MEGRRGRRIENKKVDRLATKMDKYKKKNTMEKKISIISVNKKDLEKHGRQRCEAGYLIIFINVCIMYFVPGKTHHGAFKFNIPFNAQATDHARCSLELPF